MHKRYFRHFPRLAKASRLCPQAGDAAAPRTPHKEGRKLPRACRERAAAAAASSRLSRALRLPTPAPPRFPSLPLSAPRCVTVCTQRRFGETVPCPISFSPICVPKMWCILARISTGAAHLSFTAIGNVRSALLKAPAGRTPLHVELASGGGARPAEQVCERLCSVQVLVDVHPL